MHIFPVLSVFYFVLLRSENFLNVTFVFSTIDTRKLLRFSKNVSKLFLQELNLRVFDLKRGCLSDARFIAKQAARFLSIYETYMTECGTIRARATFCGSLL